jgi:hypothetical protein
MGIEVMAPSYVLELGKELLNRPEHRRSLLYSRRGRGSGIGNGQGPQRCKFCLMMTVAAVIHAEPSTPSSVSHALSRLAIQ